MKISAFILMFLLSGSQLSAQNYADVSLAQKVVLFEEEFDQLPKEKFKVKGSKVRVESGRLIGKNNELKSLDKFLFQEAENFEIEVLVKHEITEKSSFKIIWERAPKSGKYDWPNSIFLRLLDKDLIFVTGVLGPNDLLKIEKRKFTYFFNQNGFNKYTFRYVDANYQLYINEKYVGSLPYKLLGPQMLMLRAYNTAYEFDRVSIYHLEKNE